jgi:hypothetical protein
MLTSPAAHMATASSPGRSPGRSPSTKLHTPFVPPSYTPRKSHWAAGGPLKNAANTDLTRTPARSPAASLGGGGGGGARAGGGSGGGGGGRGGGRTPSRESRPSPGPERRGSQGGGAGGRHLSLAALVAVGVATGIARQVRTAPTRAAGFKSSTSGMSTRSVPPFPQCVPLAFPAHGWLTALLGLPRWQATRLRQAPGAGFALLRRTVSSCAASLRRTSDDSGALSSALAAGPPLMLAAAASTGGAGDARLPLAVGGPSWRSGVLHASPDGGARAVASTLPFPRMYEVKEADTLWGIAQDAYGDGSRFADILAANPGAFRAAPHAADLLVLLRMRSRADHSAPLQA